MTIQMYVDGEGIPFSDYAAYRGVEIGRQRSILAVAERGLWYWNKFALGDRPDEVLLSYDWNQWPLNKEANPSSREDAQRMMLNCANWLLDSIETRGQMLVWCYPYPFRHDTKPGWRSAHAQAVGIQLLARAAELTNDARYSDPIEGLLTAFEVSITEGGLTEKSDPNFWWFEKMADSSNKQPKILNGMMFALLGLADARDRVGNRKAGELYDRGLSSTIKLLPQYDLGDWSAYDIFRKRAPVRYHNIHIRQLDLLHAMSGDATLLRYQRLFEEYKERAPS